MSRLRKETTNWHFSGVSQLFKAKAKELCTSNCKIFPPSIASPQHHDIITHIQTVNPYPSRPKRPARGATVLHLLLPTPCESKDTVIDQKN